MTASEWLFSTWSAARRYFVLMSPAEAALNVVFSLLVIGAGVVALYVGRRTIRRAARLLPGAPTAAKTVRTSRLARMFIVTLRLGSAAVVLGVVAAIWGLDPISWVPQALGGAAGRVVLVVLVSAVAFEIAGYLTDHGVVLLAARAGSRRRQAQLQTLGPLLRGATQVTILVVSTMMLLSELGVQIGPLLAGAGVVGIAVGFGAQTLVKDFLTGIFLIVEDIVSVGDIVRIGNSGGLVEKMTLRTIRLRDFDGTLHTFPYGEAQVVHNLTKTFSYCVFDLQISYGSSIDQALGLMRQVGDDLAADPEFREKILDPIEVVGVDNLADSGVMLKARMKTRPLEQWVVGREYNRRIKLAFDAAGVEIPFPHMKVVLPEGQVRELVRH